MDLFGRDSKIRRLFELDEVPRFLSAIVEEPVYQSADPILGVVVTMMRDGQKHDWHFDGNDWVCSLLLQAPEAGGEFEFVRNIRTRGNPSFEAVERLLRGSRDGVTSVPLEPGTLQLFYGDNSIHRVAPIRGRRKRIIVLLSYDSEPGQVFARNTRFNNSGRTEPLPIA